MKKIRFKSLAFHLIVPVMLLFIIWMLIPDYTVYYDGLKKPIPNLPSSVFLYIWGVINIIMGIVAYLLENGTIDEKQKDKAFQTYFLQLLFNLLWLPIFFGFQSIGMTLILTIILIIFVFIIYKRFSSIGWIGKYFFLIYLIWLLFLIYYLTSFWILNK